MKWVFTLLLILLPNVVLGQIFQLRYSYTEICSEQQKRITIPLDLSGKNTLAFFGYSISIPNGENTTRVRKSKK